jgi:hypothetical protein
MWNKFCTSCGLGFPKHKKSCKSTNKTYRVPTVEELLKDEPYTYDTQMRRETFTRDQVENFMLGFARLHAEVQREAIKKELEEGLSTFGISLVDDFKLEKTGNSLIDDAYPLDLIK